MIIALVNVTSAVIRHRNNYQESLQSESLVRLDDIQNDIWIIGPVSADSVVGDPFLLGILAQHLDLNNPLSFGRGQRKVKIRSKLGHIKVKMS